MEAQQYANINCFIAFIMAILIAGRPSAVIPTYNYIAKLQRGIKIKQIQWIFKDKKLNDYYNSSNIKFIPQYHLILLEAIKISYYNTKTTIKGQIVNVYIGRTYKKYDPLLWISYLINENIKRKFIQFDDDYVYWNTNDKPHTYSSYNKWLKSTRTLLKGIDVDDDFISRVLLHTSRKTFASILAATGQSDSFIAAMGRWRLPTAMGNYIIISKSNMMGIANMIFHKKRKYNNMIDFDAKIRRISHK